MLSCLPPYVAFTGNAALPLAALLPTCDFVLLDCHSRSVDICSERAQRAGLRNVRALKGRIEDFDERFDLCIALHACGTATDHAQLKAFACGAAFVLVPCCTGKMKHQQTQQQRKEGEQMQHKRKGHAMSRAPGADGAGGAGPVAVGGGAELEASEEQAAKRIRISDTPALLDGAVADKALAEWGEARGRGVGMGEGQGHSQVKQQDQLLHPRSDWMRSALSASEFRLLATAAEGRWAPAWAASAA